MNTHIEMHRSFSLSQRRFAAVSAFAAAACFLLAALFAPEAHAYQVKRVINGSASVGTGTEVGTVPLGIADDPLDMSKSAVFFSWYSASNDTSRMYMDVMTLIDDPENVQF
ncbi:MAG: hypothetical protein WC547_05460, partial [Candidatus Omnitrophota bacterium]